MIINFVGGLGFFNFGLFDIYFLECDCEVCLIVVIVLSG